MVAMRVGIDYGHHRPFAQMLVDQLQSGPGGFRSGQGIKNDPACLAFDKGDVGEVESTYLVNPGNDLEQAIIHVQKGLALQGRVDGLVFLVFK